MDRYITTSRAVKALDVHPDTLRAWARDGKIDFIRTDGGHRRYNIESLRKDVTNEPTTKFVLYARVSGRGQLKDLESQSKYLQSRYPGAELVTDIGSGLNFKRKGLKAILDRCLSGHKLCVVVAYKDRLARFGFELIKHVVEFNGGSVVVLSDDNESPEHELVKDLIAITTVFSARIHGFRKYASQIKKDTAGTNK